MVELSYSGRNAVDLATGTNDSNNKTILWSHLPSAYLYENAFFIRDRFGVLVVAR
jgi:hypothetical protein